MKIQIMFVVTSIMLVASVLVFALPTPVQAVNILWCSTTGLSSGCSNNKETCEKWKDEHAGAKDCFKGIL